MSNKNKEKLMFRVARGALIPADNYTISRLRAKNYHIHDLVSVTISKCRNPAFNRLAHHIGQLVVANIDDFHGMDAHKALKRLQLESNAACDEIALNIKSEAWTAIRPILPAVKMLIGILLKMIGLDITDDGLVIVRIPRSLSFESLDEGEFNEAIKKICCHLTEKYWPQCTPEEIEQMALQYLESA